MKKILLTIFSFALIAVGAHTASAQTSTTTPPAILRCNPSSSPVQVGQTVLFTATGGDGVYFWSVPEITLTNSTPVGAGLSMTYGNVGTKTATVRSGGQIATCNVQVNPIPGTIPPVIITPPGFPNTGGGGEALQMIALGLLSTLGAFGVITMLRNKMATR